MNQPTSGEEFKKRIEDAALCSMFMQRVKLAYWKKNAGKLCVMESDLDEILMVAWEDIERLNKE